MSRVWAHGGFEKLPRIDNLTLFHYLIVENEIDWLIDAVRPLMISNIGNDAAEGEIEWIDRRPHDRSVDSIERLQMNDARDLKRNVLLNGLIGQRNALVSPLLAP